jgi:tetratricopeptide (TPR) repeat protein
MKHQFNGDASREGRAALKRAIAIAPNYAPAHAYLGFLDAMDIAGNYSGEKGPEDIDEAIASIRRAIELDPSMAYAYQALGVASELKGLPEEGLRAMEKAVELGPSDADNQLLYGRLLATNGRFVEALAAGERAFALNPVAPIYYYALHARTFYGAGRYEEAVKLTQACIDRQSYHRVCRAVRIAGLVELGRLEEARAEMRDFRAHAPGFSERAAASHVGYAGDRGATERLFSRLRQAGLTGQATH